MILIIKKTINVMVISIIIENSEKENTVSELWFSEECYDECPENSRCRNGRCQCLPGFAFGPYKECYEGKVFVILAFHTDN